MRSPIIPYGFAWLEGKLVKEPREYKNVLKVICLWQAGKSFTAIARALNDQRVPTRNGKKWFHSSIGAIVKRHLEENQQTEGGPNGVQ
ncbi:MAG: recombinase family protein [Bdellovibrionaceae bacterium]|nr:recombinase family protein [Pseudobdellovibrionaceae bacterium]